MRSLSFDIAHLLAGGMLVLKFENGVWPFPDSSTPPGEQN